MSLPISAASRDAAFAQTSLWRLHAVASVPSTARVGLGVGEYAVESEIAGLPRVKGRLTRVHSIHVYWRSMGPTPSAAAGPTTTMGCSTHVPTLKAPRATLSLRGHQFQLWCEVRGWRGVRNG